MKYKVTMECTRFEVVEVTADSPDEAEAIALNGEHDCEIDTVNEGYEISSVREMK